MQDKDGLKRIYRKSWCYDNLFGSSRFEFTPSQRGIWNDLLDMAKLSRVRPGLIAPGADAKYPHPWLAEFLNLPLDLFEETLAMLIKTKRIQENGAGIEILNWKRYQTDYDRQKPYRQAAKKEIDPDKYIKGKYGHMVKQ